MVVVVIVAVVVVAVEAAEGWVAVEGEVVGAGVMVLEMVTEVCAGAAAMETMVTGARAVAAGEQDLGAGVMVAVAMA